MDRTMGFVNLNRFKSGRAIKRLNRADDKYRLKGQRRGKFWHWLASLIAGVLFILSWRRKRLPLLAEDD